MKESVSQENLPRDLWHAEKQDLKQKRSALYTAHKLRDSLRCTLTDKDFLEVETPVCIRAPAPEPYIEAVKTETRYLRTSPEFHMKRLLAAGYSRIFQLGPCFRKGEHGSHHEPEFTMLEWYRLHATERDLIADTADLIQGAAEDICGSPVLPTAHNTITLQPPWDQLSVDDAFARFADGYTVEKALDEGCFEEILGTCIEPCLGKSRPVLLYDYPVELGGFAAPYLDRPQRVRRWELYIDGVEIANACAEIVDAQEQQQRMERALHTAGYEDKNTCLSDQHFKGALLNEDLPPCAGIALGVDRLLMLFCQKDTIRAVKSFPEQSVEP